MDITITPRKLHGSISAIPSKSQMHRVLICAAFSDHPTEIQCSITSMDMIATMNCLRALGALIQSTGAGWIVHPIASVPQTAVLPCGESGSTLRFMLPIVGALGINATFQMVGRLPKRPLSPLWEEMERMGCTLSRPTPSSIRCRGRLRSGVYTIDGSVSSQFITGLLLAMALMDGTSSLTVTGKLESKPYIDITRQVLADFGVQCDNYTVVGTAQLHSPGYISIEGDWSNAAFFLAAQKLGCPLSVTELNYGSLQGDKAVINALDALDSNCIIDSANIPDLVPILAIVAGASHGATFTNIARLRLKESDRVASVVAMMEALGVQVAATDNTLIVSCGEYHSCVIHAHSDHRIAMAAAIAATVASGPVSIVGSECVSKSYPTFWEDYCKLGGYYEQYIR